MTAPLETRRRLWQLLLERHHLGRPLPSIRGLMKLLNVSSISTLQHHLKALKKDGFIQIDGCQTRTLRLLRGTGIPILGQVAAGSPIDNFGNSYEEIPVSPRMFSGSHDTVCALKVKGDSMIEADIRDGDYAIIKRQAHVESGQIAAVLIDGQGTLKRLRKNRARIELHSENPKYPPLLLSPDKDNVVFGKLIGLFRAYTG